ncbi:MAG: hypothetical protein JW888_16025 [Pirellulales bacterium]|nr:hypothetical protein [Pirellulales bacterium]
MKTALDREMAELLDALVEVEVQLGQYYKLMANFLPEYRDIWNQLRHQEEEHARAMERVREAVHQDPSLFSLGPFRAQTGKAIIRDVKEMASRILQEDVHPRYAVSFAADLEQSLLEQQAVNAVETSVPEVRCLFDQLRKETAEHRNLLRTIVI